MNDKKKKKRMLNPKRDIKTKREREKRQTEGDRSRFVIEQIHCSESFKVKVSELKLTHQNERSHL